MQSGYRRSQPPARPKLDPFLGNIDRILEEDKGQPAKQQHTSAASGCARCFVPLRHHPGHAQVDFGEALAVIGGVERKIHFFAKDLPHSDGCLLQAYPSESSEDFCEGHNVSFDLFGGYM